ncbi:hypothetical protein [Flavobacterium hiemivividum]|uniref:DUF1735 domain-containing protein n=1 Tax=Flavobacterium hiemivividum TaxID=2541734 RepID=A0A4R5CVP7_9FLAO|nr:hypothetical protein [Flavobacterium hiemivividum]TDE03777.1 hypothetical protein E0F98_09735 [Flavobacterium hiemivividum]
MKKLRVITGIALMSILGFTSCQNEVNDVSGENPNTNNSTSTTTTNYKRTAMYDGSDDDFLDGNSCTSIAFPAFATVNGTRVSLLSELSYSQVITILGRFNDDTDTVVFDFPLKVKTSNYTEVTVNSQAEYNAILSACSTAESKGENAISALEIKFPITILTYNVSFEQTGSVVITSKQQLYAYMSAVSGTELYSVKYPISVKLEDGTTTTVNSDAEFQSSITAALTTEAAIKQATENSKKLEAILEKGTFKIESFISAGVNTASNYKDNTLDFTNDWSVKAVSFLVTKATGTYEVSSSVDVFLKFNFSGNTTFSALNNTWKVVSSSASTITLQSKTNAAVTVVLTQI